MHKQMQSYYEQVDIEENIRRSEFDKLSSSDDGDDIKKMSTPKGKRTGVPINRQDLHILQQVESREHTHPGGDEYISIEHFDKLLL